MDLSTDHLPLKRNLVVAYQERQFFAFHRFPRALFRSREAENDAHGHRVQCHLRITHPRRCAIDECGRASGRKFMKVIRPRSS